MRMYKSNGTPRPRPVLMRIMLIVERFVESGVRGVVEEVVSVLRLKEYDMDNSSRLAVGGPRLKKKTSDFGI